MPRKEYYAERKGISLHTNISLDMMKSLFLNIYNRLSRENYFQEALGYKCIDEGTVYGTWGPDPGAFVFQKLWTEKLWPLEENIRRWSEAEFFTMVEFLYDHVSAPDKGRYHSFEDCGWHGTTWNRETGRRRYRDDVNQILKAYDSGYSLSEQGEILEAVPRGIDSLVENMAQSGEGPKIDDRVQTAIRRFRNHRASLDDKKEAIRTLGDVLEFLKDSGYALPRQDDSSLFHIINKFDLRHHNPTQLADYSREEFFPWIFYTTLASIDLLVRLRGQTDSAKTL